MGEMIASLVGVKGTAYEEYITMARKRRDEQRKIVNALSWAAKNHLLFDFYSTGNAPSFASTSIQIQNLPQELRDQLLAIASGSLPLKAASGRGVPAKP